MNNDAADQWYASTSRAPQILKNKPEIDKLLDKIAWQNLNYYEQFSIVADLIRSRELFDGRFCIEDF